MKLATFSHGGKTSYGAVVGDGIIDLGKKLGDRYPDLRSLLKGDGLAAAKSAVDGAFRRRESVAFEQAAQVRIAVAELLAEIDNAVSDHGAIAGLAAMGKCRELHGLPLTGLKGRD